MQSWIFHSTDASLSLAVGQIRRQLEKERLVDRFDFALIGLSCRYPVWEVNAALSELAPPEKFVAFHATDAFDNETIVSHGVTALFVRFERRGRVECFVQEGLHLSSREALARTENYLKDRKGALHLMIAGQCDAKIAFFIEKLSQSGVAVETLLGGISSGCRVAERELTCQFYEGRVIENGFVIVTFHDVEMATSIASGFEPVGVHYTVTRAEGYRIYQVDDHQSFTYTVEKLARGIEGFKSEYLWYTPIVVMGEEEEGFVTLRTFKERGSDWVAFFGPVREGQKIRLSYGEKEHLLAAAVKSAGSVASKLPDPELLFNFSCVARQYVLEDEPHKESRIYRDYLRAPLFGFFTYGEIGHDPAGNSLQFYNETSLLIAMAER